MWVWGVWFAIFSRTEKFSDSDRSLISNLSLLNSILFVYISLPFCYILICTKQHFYFLLFYQTSNTNENFSFVNMINKKKNISMIWTSTEKKNRNTIYSLLNPHYFFLTHFYPKKKKTCFIKLGYNVSITLN